MLHASQVFFGLVVLPFLLAVFACSGSDKSSHGVAKIDPAQSVRAEKTLVSETKPQTDKTAASDSDIGTSIQQVSNAESTDEEIAALFVTCMRDHGFSVKDPELNADGTIAWGPIKASLGQLEKTNVKMRKAYDECLPLLEGITNTKEEEREDQTELRDNLLRFTECLRDKGVNVSDPDFTDETDRGYKTFLDGLSKLGPKEQRSLDQCEGLVFGTKVSGDGKK